MNGVNGSPDLTLALASSVRALQDDPKEAKQRFHEAAERAAPERPLCESCGKPVKHRQGVDWCWDRQMSEKTLQSRIVDRAKRRGYRVEHVGKGMATFDSNGDPIWVTTGDPGWPDLTLAKPGHHLIFMELKKEEGIVSPEQLEWLQLLNQTGNFAIVVRPSDLRLKRVNAILARGAPL